MFLHLRDQLSWCECAGRIILLDILADRYFCLPAEARQPFLALAGGTLDPHDATRLKMLTRRGLLVLSSSPQPFPLPPQIDPPISDVLADPLSRSRVLPIARALAREAGAAWELRTLPFSEVIARARRRPIQPPGRVDSTEPVIRSIAAAADSIAFLTRAHDRCLIRGLGVHAACRAHGIIAKFVIGVIGHPFAAHCWVQVKDTVLVGDFEQARLYTPILVLE